jgi:hypothetical protein
MPKIHIRKIFKWVPRVYVGGIFKWMPTLWVPEFDYRPSTKYVASMRLKIHWLRVAAVIVWEGCNAKN